MLRGDLRHFGFPRLYVLPMTIPTLMPESIRIASGSIYHYTSTPGLLAVITSGKFWASEASSLNDRAEVRQGWEAIQHHLRRHKKTVAGEWLMKHATPSLNKKAHDVFILCASTRDDDANQWRLYATGGRGYSIELDAGIQLAAFSENLLELSPKTGNPRFGFRTATSLANVTPWMHVLYTEQEIGVAVDELVASVDAEIKDLEQESNSEAKDHFGELLQEDAREALEGMAHIIKSPGFSGENEVRAVATFFWGRDHIGYRASATGVAGYAVLTSAPNGNGDTVSGPPYAPSLPIRGIRLGPLLAEENVPTVEGLLGQQGLRELPVRTSEVPLR